MRRGESTGSLQRAGSQLLVGRGIGDIRIEPSHGVRGNANSKWKVSFRGYSVITRFWAPSLFAHLAFGKCPELTDSLTNWDKLQVAVVTLAKWGQCNNMMGMGPKLLHRGVQAIETAPFWRASRREEHAGEGP